MHSYAYFFPAFFQFHALKSRLLSLNTPTVKRMRRMDTDCSACMFFCSLQIGTGRFSHITYRWYAYAPAIKNSGNAPYVVHSVLHRQAPLDGFMIYQCAMLKCPVLKKRDLPIPLFHLCHESFCPKQIAGTFSTGWRPCPSHSPRPRGDSRWEVRSEKELRYENHSPCYP